jgi:hypothetical protein
MNGTTVGAATVILIILAVATFSFVLTGAQPKALTQTTTLLTPTASSTTTSLSPTTEADHYGKHQLDHVHDPDNHYDNVHDNYDVHVPDNHDYDNYDVHVPDNHNYDDVHDNYEVHDVHVHDVHDHAAASSWRHRNDNDL